MFLYFIFIAAILGVLIRRVFNAGDKQLHELVKESVPTLEVDMMVEVKFSYVNPMYSGGFASGRFVGTFMDFEEAKFITSCELILNIYESEKDNEVIIDKVSFFHFDDL